MLKLVLLSLTFGVMVTVGMPNIDDYEYQYDEPQDGFSDEVMEKEVATNEKIKMITEPLNIVAIAGDRVELPCRVEKLPSKDKISE